VIAERITAFSGAVPRLGARMLRENQAQLAVNCRLTSGYLEPLRAPLIANAAPGVTGIKSFHRLVSGGSPIFLVWDKDVDAVRAPIAGDTTLRLYYTGDNEPRVTNYAMATSTTPYPGSCFVLGVSPPITAPSVSASATGSGQPDTRAYVYTFTTPWGEESAPSPPSTLTTGKIDDTWTISGMDAAPLNAFTVTGGSWAANVATLTVASTFGLRAGETITVTGVTPAGYNAARVKVTAVTSTTLSYTLLTNPGAWSAGGTTTRAAAHNTTGMVKRIYRTVTDASGVTAYRFVKEVPVSTTSTTEAITLSGEAIVTTGWLMPPADLVNIVAMPNGVMAGISGNQVCFCEPFKPYAWPLAYRAAMDFNGVSAGVFGNSVVVTTEANPYVYTGNDPTSLVASGIKIDQPWPCVSRRSTVEMGFGVGYATDYGFVVVGGGAPVNITEGTYTELEWKALSPSEMIGALYSGRLYLSTLTDGVNRQMIVLDKESGTVINANSQVSAMWRDPTTGVLYVCVKDQIFQWDADNGVKLAADWYSKEFTFPAPVNIGVVRVDGEFAMTSEDIASAQNAGAIQKSINQALITALATKGGLNAASVGLLSVNGSLIKPLPVIPWDSLQFAIYIDGKLKYSASVTSNAAFKLPASYKSDNIAFRVSGNVGVRSIMYGETMKDLARVPS
jgi:hypothetical protein